MIIVQNFEKILILEIWQIKKQGIEIYLCCIRFYVM